MKVFIVIVFLVVLLVGCGGNEGAGVSPPFVDLYRAVVYSEVAVVDDGQRHPFLGLPVSLDEARGVPGLYIKEGDGFVLVQPQWRFATTLDVMHMPAVVVSSTVAAGLFRGRSMVSARDSNIPLSILLENSFQVPTIPNDAQLVLIGVENINIINVDNFNWALPHHVYRYRDTVRMDINGVVRTDRLHNRTVETINGLPATDFNDYISNGLFIGAAGEQYTFGWWEGTDRIELNFAARRNFTLPRIWAHGWTGTTFFDNHEIVRTQNGYFEVNFINPPIGLYAIGPLAVPVGAARGDANNVYASFFDRIVEFVAP